MFFINFWSNDFSNIKNYFGEFSSKTVWPYIDQTKFKFKTI